MQNLKPREMNVILVVLAASLLSFQLFNKGIISVVDDDEVEIYGFCKETSPVIVV
jgi:hypothetical protein